MKNLKISNKLKLYTLLGTMILSPITINNNVYAKNNTTIEKNIDDDLTLLEAVEKYGKIYSIREDSLLDHIDYVTNGYSDLTDDNWEKTVLDCAKNLYEDSRENGYYDKITTGEEYIVKDDPEVLIEYYSDLIGVNKYIPLAISLAEKEPHKYLRDDYNYSTHGILGGLCSPSHFENGEIGVISYIYTLKNKYGVDIDSDESILSEMAPVYCPPNSYGWEHNLVKPIYNELKENGYYSRSPEDIQNNKTKQK